MEFLFLPAWLVFSTCVLGLAGRILLPRRS
jgi:hypothetical protein